MSNRQQPTPRSERREKIASLIQKTLAPLLQQSHIIGIELLSIHYVRMNKDLSIATVYVDSFDLDKDMAVVCKQLNAHSYVLRRQLATRVALRRIPELRFAIDASLTRGNRIESIIDNYQALQE